MNFDDIVAKVKECGKKTVAVSVAQDSAVLEAVHEAKSCLLYTSHQFGQLLDGDILNIMGF